MSTSPGQGRVLLSLSGKLGSSMSQSRSGPFVEASQVSILRRGSGIYDTVRSDVQEYQSGGARGE
jgi:hypothetical protein